MAIRNLLKHIIGCVTSVCVGGLFAFGAATFELQTQKKGVVEKRGF